MKFCEECGAQLEDDVMFCDECGAKIEVLEENVVVASEPQPTSKPVETFTDKHPNNKSISKIYILGGAVGLVLVAVIIVLVIMLLKKSDNTIPFVDTGETTTVEIGNEQEIENYTTEASTKENNDSPADGYQYFNKYISLVGSISDWPSGLSELELYEYQRDSYINWVNGEVFNEIVVDENGDLYFELFSGAKYGVCNIYWTVDGCTYRLTIHKVDSEYAVNFIIDSEYSDIMRYGVIQDGSFYYGKENSVEFMFSQYRAYCYTVNFKPDYNNRTCIAEILVGNVLDGNTVMIESKSVNFNVRCFDDLGEYDEYVQIG